MTQERTEQNGIPSRAAKRPLSELTEHELDALDVLGGHLALFSDHIGNALAGLSELAARELADRHLGQECSS